MNIYKERFKIKASETDANQFIHIPAVGNYLQEAAWSHAIDLGVSVYELIDKGLIDKGLTWVMFRLYLELYESVKHRDEVIIKTWPSGVNQKYVFRDFQILNSENKIIGKAKSSWVVFDFHKRTVCPVPDFIRKIPIVDDEHNVEYPNNKIASLSEYESSKSIVVGWHDIDINRHVNNVSYIKWLIESIPNLFLQKHKPESLDIVFRSECSLGDSINMLTHSFENEKIFFHKLTSHDNKELIIAKSKWKAV